MSKLFYEFYSTFLDFIKEEKESLYRISPQDYSEFLLIPMETAIAIHSVHNDPVLSQPLVFAGLLTISKIKTTPDFWKKFRPSVLYIFIEFAKNNFFPLTYNVDINTYRHKFEIAMDYQREYKRMYPIASEKVKHYENYFEYISRRTRGNSTRLANLAIAATIIPYGIFDWKSCLRNDEGEQLMMLGIQDIEPLVFNEWVQLYEKN